MDVHAFCFAKGKAKQTFAKREIKKSENLHSITKSPQSEKHVFFTSLRFVSVSVF